MDQKALFDKSPISPRVEPIRSLERGIEPELPLKQQFQIFHKTNPHVFQLIAKIALDLKARGHRHGAIGLVYERIRWLWAIQTKGDFYKLNNNYKPFYSRLVMAEIPELHKWFHTRGGRHQRD